MSKEWSKKEKKIVRDAFDLAYSREVENIIKFIKEVDISTPDELWEFCDELEKKRKDVGEIFDFRYSILPMVLGLLVSKGLLNKKELEGIGEDKLALVKEINKDL